jgi:hypothetical protein
VPILGLLPRACELCVDGGVIIYLVLLGAKSGAATAKLDLIIIPDFLLWGRSLVPHVMALLISCQALPAGVVAHSYGVSQLVESYTF